MAKTYNHHPADAFMAIFGLHREDQMEPYQDTRADAFAAFVDASSNLNPLAELISDMEHYLCPVEHSDDPRELRQAVQCAMRCVRMMTGAQA